MGIGEAARDRLRATVFRARGVANTRFALRMHRVEVVWDYAGGDPRDHVSERAHELLEGAGSPPQVEWLNEEELAVGSLPAGTIRIPRITPSFSSGGTDRELLRKRLNSGDKIHLRITGPHHPEGALYRITKIDDSKALHFSIQAVPVEDETYSP